MPNVHRGERPIGPDEGHYDLRAGAAAYAPIVAAFGALAVAAIIVVFTTTPTSSDSEVEIGLCVGLLALGVFGSTVGAIGLGAIGAERDPTANLVPALLFIAVPVALSTLGTLSAFEVLAAIYVPSSVPLFIAIAGAGCAFSISFTAFVLGDTLNSHPTTMTKREFDSWVSRQWLHSAGQAYRAASVTAVVTSAPVLVLVILRLAGVPGLPLSSVLVNLSGGAGIALCVAGTLLSITRTLHPELGNEQVGVKHWEAWAATSSISAYSFLVLLLLPDGQ